MNRIVVPPCSGILCAEGVMNAHLSIEFVTTLLIPVSPEAAGTLMYTAAEPGTRVTIWFVSEGVPESRKRTIWSIAARYFRQNYELTLPIDIPASGGSLLESIESSFLDAHERNYGFALLASLSSWSTCR